MGTYERKTRDIKRSLHRRARIRRAYFKMIGEDPKKKTQENKEANDIDAGNEIDLSDVSGSDNESETRPTRLGKNEETKPSPEPKLTGRQLARRKRAEEYHRKKEQEAEVAKARHRRDAHKNTMMKRSKRGQPKLGSQMGVLLDKIRKTT